MNNAILNWIITIVEGIRPELAPFLEDIKADIASGKTLVLADIEKAVNDAFAAAEIDLPKFKNSLSETDKLLNQAIVTEQAWAADLAAK